MEINFNDIKKFCRFYSFGYDTKGKTIENCFYNQSAKDEWWLSSCCKERCPLCEERISRSAAINILEEDIENCYTFKELKEDDPRFKDLLAAKELAVTYLKRWDDLPKEISDYILEVGRNSEKFEWGDEIKYNASDIKKILEEFCKEEKF